MPNQAGLDMSSPPAIFLHIPKAAGSSLGRVIRRQYRASETYLIDGTNVQASIQQFRRLPSSRRGQIKLLAGHMQFGLHAYLAAPARYITMLREPISRAISFYHYVYREPSHYLHDFVTTREMDLREFIERRLTVEMNNGQVRLLCNTAGAMFPDEHGEIIGHGKCTAEMLRQAKHNLETHFSVVGLTRRFDESLMLMKHAFSWGNIFYLRRNVSYDRPPLKEVAPDVIRLIEGHNQLDIELCQHAEQVFLRQISEEPHAFQREVERFTRLNNSLNRLIPRFFATRFFK